MMQTVLLDTGKSNYIGRAQKILILQQRINELQAKQSDSKIKELHNSTGIIVVVIFIHKMHFIGKYYWISIHIFVWLYILFEP